MMRLANVTRQDFGQIVKKTGFVISSSLPEAVTGEKVQIPDFRETPKDNLRLLAVASEMMRHFRYAAAGLVLTLGLSGCISATAARPEVPVLYCTEDGKDSGNFLSGKNMLTGFLLIGPFPVTGNRGSMAQDSLHFSHLPNESDFRGNTRNFPESIRTVVLPEDPKTISCDINAVFPSAKIVYALACIESGRQCRNLALHLGSSGYIKVWWNGSLVHTYDKTPRIGTLDQGIAKDLTLNKGKNLLLVKCVRTGKKWDLFCRFSVNGQPLLLRPAVQAQ